MARLPPSQGGFEYLSGFFTFVLAGAAQGKVARSRHGYVMGDPFDALMGKAPVTPLMLIAVN
jgi:hypothetical protein